MTENEAKEIYLKFKELKKMASLDNKYKRDLSNYEKIIIEKFQYIVMAKTSKYRKFNNYSDLNQEGLEAILRAMNSYDINKGSIFWWIHKYVNTRIFRAANNHTAIKFPIKIAHNVAPKRESVSMYLQDTKPDPFESLDLKEKVNFINSNFNKLSDDEKILLNSFYDLNDSFDKIEINRTKSNAKLKKIIRKMQQY
ncbi:MAG: hypothetical protein LC122_13320 [Chitinophagales bacterium]|nr:hypothetical protein [Chitinophagales bacterium]